MEKHVPILLTITTAFLYVLGITYYESFLSFFGIDKSQFPLSFDIILFKGFVSSVMLGLKSIGYFYFSAIGVVLITVGGSFFFKAVSEHKILNYLKSKYESAAKQEASNNKIKEGGLTEFSFKVFELFSGVTLAFILLILMILLSAMAGKESASKFVERCDKGLIAENKIYIKNSDKIINGCAIACSSTQCAYQSKNKVVIINSDGAIYSEIIK